MTMTNDDGNVTFNITFPKKRPAKTVETTMMRVIMERTLSVHPLNSLVVWHGKSRIGKTTTARLLTEKINDAYDPDDLDAFHAMYYEVGEIQNWTGHEMKRGIKSLYNASLSTQLDESVYVRNPPEHLAGLLVHGLRVRNISMIFVDEAGCLSVDAIRGMVLVRDIAENTGWPLSLIFVGMDDLPVKMTRLPQIENRIHEWCFFKEYDFDSTWAMLAELHPHFASLNSSCPEHHEQVKFIHERYGGFPGLLVPFLQRLEHRFKHLSSTGAVTAIDLTLLRAVHLLTARDKELSISESEQSRGVKPAPLEHVRVTTRPASSSTKKKSHSKQVSSSSHEDKSN